mgnify:CR=1 FL=1
MNKPCLSALAVLLLVAALPAPALAAAQARASNPAEIVPAEAPFYLTLDTRAGFAVKVERLLSRLAGQNVAGQGELALDQVVFSLLGDPAATFADDVRPWLGDQIVITSPQMPSVSALMMAANSAFAPGFTPALIASVTDKSAARNFIARLLNRETLAEATRSEVDYNGYSYTLVRPADSRNRQEGLNLGIIEDYLVIAYGVRSIEPIIGAASGAPALADTPGFRRIFGEMDPDSFVRLYVGPSLPAGVVGDSFVWNLIVEGRQSIKAPLPGLDLSDPAALQRQLLDVIETFHGVGLDFRMVENALVMDFIGGFDMAALDAVLGAPQPRLERGVGEAIIARFPADAIGVVGWNDLGANIENWFSMASYDPAAQAELEQVLADFETQTGLKLADVLAWMRGSVAAGILLNARGAQEPVSLAAVIEATDLDRAQQTLDALPGIAERQGEKIEVAEIDGVQVMTIAASAPDQPPVQIALMDNYVVLVIGEGMARMIETARGGPNYTQNPEWARLMRIANADGPFLAALDIAGFGEYSEAMGMTPADRAMLVTLKTLQSAAVIAPASPGGGPARFSFILTLAGE